MVAQAIPEHTHEAPIFGGLFGGLFANRQIEQKKAPRAKDRTSFSEFRIIQEIAFTFAFRRKRYISYWAFITSEMQWQD